jgi:CxxC-x17-CxxC domain-containing protein
MTKAKSKKEKTLKAPKVSKKSKKVDEPMMPTIVEGLMKMVERLEIVERKIDQVNSRISNVLFEIRDELRSGSNQNASHQQNPFGYAPQPKPLPQRQMYQVICADCKKNTEVPFKPGDRPVYCKECFSARKAGNIPVAAARVAQSAEVKKKTAKKK